MMVEKLDINSKVTYFIGAQYINGPYKTVDKSTGEVSSGISDKVVLQFIKPLDPMAFNSKRVIGTGVFTETVKTEHLPHIFDIEPKLFDMDMLDVMAGSPVNLEYDVSHTQRGSFARLRNVREIK